MNNSTNERMISITEKDYQELIKAKNVYDSFLSSDGYYSIDKVAKILNFEGGRTKLLETLRRDGILMKTSENTPLQQYFDKGYFRMKISDWNVYYSKSFFVFYTTHKGLRWLYRRYGRLKESDDKFKCNCFADK